MKIYVLTDSCMDHYESNLLYGVYSRRELAEAAMIRIRDKPSDRFGNPCEIKEITLDEDINGD